MEIPSFFKYLEFQKREDILFLFIIEEEKWEIQWGSFQR